MCTLDHVLLNPILKQLGGCERERGGGGAKELKPFSSYALSLGMVTRPHII